MATFLLSNSPSVSFGSNASSVYTASALVTGAAGVGSLNASTGELSISGSALVSVSNNASTILISGRSVSLNEVQNPGADALLLMAANAVQFQWGTNLTNFVTAASRQGLFEIDVVGGTAMTSVSAHILHIHQSSNDLPLHLIHLEQVGTRGTPLHIVAGGTVAAVMNAPISFNGGSAPMILGTSQSNVVSNLNAFYLEGTRGSDYAARTHLHGALALTNLTGTSASSGLSLSAAAPGGGAGATISAWPLVPNVGFTLGSIASATTNNTGGSTQITAIGYLHSYPFPHDLHLNNLEMIVSGTNAAGTGSATLGVQLGFYTVNANTVLSLVTSFAWGMVVSQNSTTANSYQWWWGTNSAANSSATSGGVKTQFNNARLIVLNATPATIPAGNYYVAAMFSHRFSSASASLFQSLAYFQGSTTTHGSRMGGTAWEGTGFMGSFSISTNTNVVINGLLLPAALATSLIDSTNNARMSRPYWLAWRSAT